MENGATPFGAVAFVSEQFYVSCVNVKQVQMVPEVVAMEKECVLNQKSPIFFGIWLVK